MLTKIKKYWFLFILIFIQSSLALAQTEVKTPLSYLASMVETHKKSNYELLYILQQNGDIDSFRLRHTFVDGKEYALLLNLDHSREEIVLRDQTVSYFGNNFRPFSLNSAAILDHLPNVLYTDYETLSGYVFLDAGKDRISDRITRVIRLVPNDNFRYSYTLWIDEESRLLLKSQLHSTDNRILEEFRVLSLYQSEDLEKTASAIEALMLPPLAASQDRVQPSGDNWQVGWLPTGFQLIDNQAIKGFVSQLETEENEEIESRLYRDGLLTFNIYIMPSQGVNFDEYIWQQGKLTVLNQTIDDKDIVIIGEIPFQSAKKILDNLSFSGESAQ